MSIRIRRAILHKLDKQQHSNEVSMELRSSLLDTEGHLQDLVDNILDRYTDKAKVFGSFSEDPEKQAFKRLLASNSLSNDEEFVDFSVQSCGMLKSALEQATAAVSGYYILVDFDLGGVNQSSHLLVVMLKNTQGFQVDANNNITSVPHLDIKDLHMVARVNRNLLALDDTANYLSFLSTRGDDVANYFVDFIGGNKVTTASEDSMLLVEKTTEYLDSLEMSEEEREGRRHEVYQELNGRQEVSLDELSGIISPDQPSNFVTYIDGDVDAKMPDTVHLASPQLRQLTSVKAHGQGWRITLDRQLRGKAFSIDKENGTITLFNVSADTLDEL